MAKKESKSKQHTRDLVAGMVSSNSQSRTPVSSLYQKKTKVKAATTSGASRNKGTRQENKNNPNRTPEKFLLSVTNPGNRPTAPDSPGLQPVAISNPATDLAAGRLRYESYRGGFNKRAKSYNADISDYNSKTSAYSTRQTERTAWQRAIGTYNTNLANYNNRTLPDWTAANTQYTSNLAKNTKTTSKYNKDIKNFISSLGGKNKGEVSFKTAAKTRGARNTNTRLGGARS